MNFFKSSLLLFPVLIVFSCGQISKTPQSLTFKTNEISKKIGKCIEKGSNCLEINIKYPEAVGGSDSVNFQLNSYIKEAVLSNINFENTPSIDSNQTITTAVAELENEFIDYLQDTDYNSGWFIDLTGSVTFSDSNYVSFDFTVSRFLGGAHPISVVSKSIFDTKTGKKLTLNEMNYDIEKLTELAEEKFRIAKKLEKADSLEEAGYWFDNDKFSLPVNIGLTRNGMQLFYNFYEIAPYAEGATSIILTNKELENLLMNE